MSRYYVLAPNRQRDTASIWRIDDTDQDFDTEVINRPDESYPNTPEFARRKQWFDDVVAGLRATGLCEPTDRTADQDSA